MRYLSIKNLAEHQHYKDRNPPWIKLHAKILSNYEFGCLQDASKAHLMLLWVLASRLDNRIPYDLAWLTKQLGATSPIDVEELVLQGFIEVSQDDGKMLASRKQSATPETERETEKRKRTTVASGEANAGWVVEGVDWWSKNVGIIKHGRFGNDLKTAVDLHGWPAVFAAMRCYADDAKVRGKSAKVEWFAGEVVKWIEWAGMPGTDENGDLTPRGRAALGLSA
jgi:hypothetical protein